MVAYSKIVELSKVENEKILIDGLYYDKLEVSRLLSTLKGSKLMRTSEGTPQEDSK